MQTSPSWGSPKAQTAIKILKQATSKAVENINTKLPDANEQNTFNSVKEKLRYNSQQISEVLHLDHQGEHLAALY